MKVLILCNVVPKTIMELNKIQCGYAEGWVSAFLSEMERKSDLDICVCFPLPRGLGKKEYSLGKCNYYGFTNLYISPTRYDVSLEHQFQTILAKEKPDVVHIFGTEYPHTLAMVKAFAKPDCTVIHIQGLVSMYAQHYCGFLPYAVTKKATFRDLIKHDNIVRQKRKFEMRGSFEIEALKLAGHVMGRTDWDEACCKLINPNIKYHYVQEAMRPEFYEGHWSYDDCEKHSIFMSQGGYPIKGLHLALEAVYMLKTKYPDVKLYVAGADIIHVNGIKQKIKKTYYAKYIAALIAKWNLYDAIIFLGPLNAQKMKDRYLLSNVFILPSVIENSPNSIGEAMLLGVPIVSADVGGVASLISNKENGILYQADAPYMLARYVGEIFEKRELAEAMSEKEQKKAEVIYNPDDIVEQVINVYNIMEDVG